uniref:Uncharacterized protein n=1 Tax=Anguilla anguilla TaxID=7936 RepID=A0A0E9QU90_ANGAN
MPGVSDISSVTCTHAHNDDTVEGQKISFRPLFITINLQVSKCLWARYHCQNEETTTSSVIFCFLDIGKLPHAMLTTVSHQ